MDIASSVIYSEIRQHFSNSVLLPVSATITVIRIHKVPVPQLYIGTTIVTWQDYGYAHKHAYKARYFNCITADDHWLLSVRFHDLS